MVRLREDAALTALLGPDGEVYGMRQPVDSKYPFVRYGSPSVLPFTASCMDGSAITVDIHCFAGGPGQSEDAAVHIAAAVVDCLDRATLDLGGENKGRVIWTGGQTMRDPDEQDIWHAVRTFDIEGVA